MLKMIAIGNLTGDPVLKTNEETGSPMPSCVLPRIAATNLRMEKS